MQGFQWVFLTTSIRSAHGDTGVSDWGYTCQDCTPPWPSTLVPCFPWGAFTLALQSDTKQEMLCLDLPGGDTTDGNALWVWDCNGSDNQRWIWDADTWQIQYAADPSKCVDAGTYGVSESLMIWSCDSWTVRDAWQQWSFDRNSGSMYNGYWGYGEDFAMHVDDQAVPGAKVGTYSPEFNPDQVWTIWPTSLAVKNATQQMLVV